LGTQQDLWRLDAVGLAELTRTGQVSAREATESHLARLDAVNPKINAVVHRCHDEARAAAAQADARRAAGEPLGPLHGVPVTIKITADQKGHPTDNGVPMYRNLVAQSDSEVVARLRAAGAIIVGRTNSPAFAMRFMTDNLLHGKTLNPWNPRVACGGSSGGAGAAAAVGIGTIAHGSDIGGSIRWPAFCNGIVGLRPTPGRVPSYNATGTMHRPLAAQLMAVGGPMARSVRDARLGFELMAGPHACDPLTVDVPLRGRSLGAPVRVALMPEPEGAPVHPAVSTAVRLAGKHLAAAGYAVEELDASRFPSSFGRGAELWNKVGMAEIRSIIEPVLPAIGDEGLERSLRFWWDICGPVSMAEYHAALAERDTLIRQWQLFLEQYPVVVLPTFGQPSAEAFCDQRDRDGMAFCIREGRLLFTLSVLGFPVLAMPVGSHEGQPQGVQIFSRRFREDVVLDAGAAIESAEGLRPAIDPRF
jgi:amidase